MVECQDCNKKEAQYIVYDQDKGNWFKLCPDCIGENDLVCPFEVL